MAKRKPVSVNVKLDRQLWAMGYTFGERVAGFRKLRGRKRSVAALVAAIESVKAGCTRR